MEIIRKIVGLAIAVWALGAGAALAQQAPAVPQAAPQAPAGHPSVAALSFAVVDIPYLVQNSTAGRSARALMEKARASYEKSLKADQEKVRKLNESLVAERGTLSPQAYRQRVLDFRKKVATYQRLAHGRQVKLEEAAHDAAQKIEIVIVQIVGEIAKERGLSLVLSRSTLIGGSGVTDITQEVLPRLNQRLASVKIELPK